MFGFKRPALNLPTVSILEPLELVQKEPLVQAHTSLEVLPPEPLEDIKPIEVEQPTSVVICEQRFVDIDTNEVVTQSVISAPIEPERVPEQLVSYSEMRQALDVVNDKYLSELRLTGNAHDEHALTYGMVGLTNTLKTFNEWQDCDMIVGHIFGGSYDLWVKDYDAEQKQFFGFASFGGIDDMCAEWGYVSIEELLTIPFINRDFYWNPCELSELRDTSEESEMLESAVDAVTESQAEVIPVEEPEEIIPDVVPEEVTPEPIPVQTGWDFGDLSGVHATHPPVFQRENDITKRKLMNYECLYENVSPNYLYTYSGLGKLHEVDFKMGNFHDYTKAKQQFEMGQFYTPDIIGMAIAKLISPNAESTILDMTCGTGRLLNFYPNQNRLIGHDIDSNALFVAKKLYPNADIRTRSLTEPMGYLMNTIDYCIGNPPFNIVFNGYYSNPLSTDTEEEDGGKGNLISQNLYLHNTYRYLHPGGISVMIVPETFGKGLRYSKVRNYIAENFVHFADIILPEDAFKEYNCDVRTKLVVLAKKNPDIVHPYVEPITTTYNEFLSTDNGKLFLHYRKMNNSTHVANRLKKIRRDAKYEAQKKDLRTKALIAIDRAKNLIGLEYQKFITAEAMGIREQMDLDDLLGRLKREIRKQKSKIGLWVRVYRNNHKIVIARGSPSISSLFNEEFPSSHSEYKLTDLIVNPEYRKSFYAFLDYLDSGLKIKYRGEIQSISVSYEIDIRKFIDKKVRQFEVLDTPFDKIEEKYKDKYNELYESVGELEMGDKQLLPHQQEDVAKSLFKPYALYSWETGLGKTMGGIAWSIMRGGKTIVFAPSMNITDPWMQQLSAYAKGKTVFQYKKKGDLKKYRGQDYLVLSIESTSSEQLMRELRKLKFRNVIVDESDNIKSKTSLRYKAIRKYTRRIKHKLIMTATPTRNNVVEIYNQLELLCNNSVGMMCYCKRQIEYDRRTKEYAEFGCPYFGLPFPAYGGHKTFERCFAPEKLTCFGAQETNQDIFNSDRLDDLLSKIRLTRIFDEEKPRINAILGMEDHDEYKEYKNVIVPMSPTEIKVYDFIMKEFTEKLEAYYAAQHDGQTASMIVIMQQIFNLLQGTSHPWTYEAYDLEEKTSSKMEKSFEIIEQAFKEGRKVMMASPWVPTSEVLEQKFIERGYPTYRIYSEMSKKKRAEVIAQFRAHEGPAIITGTFGVLKSGLNLPEVSVVIAESYPWNFAQLHQYAARAIRLNSPEKTTIYCITAEGSFDVNVFSLLIRKEVTNTFVRTGKLGEFDSIVEGFGSDKDLFAQAMEMVSVRTATATKARINWSHKQTVHTSAE